MAEANEETREKRRSYRSVFWVIFICLIFFLLYSSTPGLVKAKRSAWDSRAKAVLRAYGETQTSYMQKNPTGEYASWDYLVKYERVEEGFTRGNLIENYSLWTCIEQDEFIAIAFPRKTTPPGYLATFSIREDQVVRKYYPEPEMTEWNEDEDCVLTWEPIR